MRILLNPVKANLTAFVLISLFVCIAYSNTFAVPFMFDDLGSIVHQAKIYESDLYALFKRYGLRTVAYVTFKFNYWINGFDVLGYHLINTLIHCLTACFVFLLVNLMCLNSVDEKVKAKAYLIAALTALIFALHPLQTQAVTYIVQRIASLAALFYIIAMYTYLKARFSTSNKAMCLYFFACLCVTGLALFTKQNTFTLPMSFLLLELIVVQQSKGLPLTRLIKPIGSLAFISIVFVLVLYHWFPELLSTVDRLTRENKEITRLQYLHTQLGVVADYIRLFFWPFGQQMEYVVTLKDGSFKGSYLLVSVYVSLIIAALCLIKRIPIIAFSIVFYFVAHLVESGLIPISDLAFEHRTYLPNFGLALITAYMLAMFVQRLNKFGTLFSITVLVALMTITIERNKQWSEPELLYQAELAVNPNKPRIHGELGLLYREQGEYEKSANSFRNAYKYSGAIGDLDNQAVNLKYDYFNNYLTALMRAGEYDNAIQEAEKVVDKVRIPRQLAHIYMNIGLSYKYKEHYKSCTKYFFKAMHKTSKQVEARIGLGECFAAMGKKKLAKRMYKHALNIEPNSARVMASMKKVGL